MKVQEREALRPKTSDGKSKLYEMSYPYASPNVHRKKSKHTKN